MPALRGLGTHSGDLGPDEVSKVAGAGGEEEPSASTPQAALFAAIRAASVSSPPPSSPSSDADMDLELDEGLSGDIPRDEIPLGRSGAKVILATHLHADCDPQLASGYAFLGMDARTIRAVDEGKRNEIGTSVREGGKRLPTKGGGERCLRGRGLRGSGDTVAEGLSIYPIYLSTYIHIYIHDLGVRDVVRVRRSGSVPFLSLSLSLLLSLSLSLSFSLSPSLSLSLSLSFEISPHLT